MTRKLLYNEESKVIGVRVPKSKFEEMKKPVRDFAIYYANDGKCIKDILKESDDLRKFKEAVVAEWKANELTPEDFKEILNTDYKDC